MKTTLILEDDFDLAAHWRELLEAEGIRVIHECTAEDAIAVLRDESVDLLITDMVIQDAQKNVSLYGGLMVISYIAMNLDPPPKIMAVTGVDTDATFLSTYELLNPDTALRKPVEDSVLAEKVQVLLAEGEQDELGRENAKFIERRMRRSLFTMDRSNEAIYWVDHQGEIVYANSAAGKMFGRASDDLIGQCLINISPDLIGEQWHSHWLEMSQSRYQTTESKRVNEDGSECWFLVDLQFYELDDDQFIVANATDITRMKADAERLRAANEDLERSNTELERFAYVASHDLKSPLRGISNCIRFLGEDFGEQIDEQAQTYFAAMTSSVTRMNQIIDDLLLYSRVLREESVWKPVGLNACIEFAVNNLSVSLEESNAVLHVGELPSISGFAPLLRQLFQNLIGNAIKYRGDAAPEIWIEGTSSKNAIEVRIRDNGIGISPEYREQVFEIFRRLHHKSEYSGTGIGLAICQRVMERHNGSIMIESNQDGQGCCFALKFPTS